MEVAMLPGPSSGRVIPCRPEEGEGDKKGVSQMFWLLLSSILGKAGGETCAGEGAEKGSGAKGEEKSLSSLAGDALLLKVVPGQGGAGGAEPLKERPGGAGMGPFIPELLSREGENRGAGVRLQKPQGVPLPEGKSILSGVFPPGVEVEGEEPPPGTVPAETASQSFRSRHGGKVEEAAAESLPAGSPIPAEAQEAAVERPERMILPRKERERPLLEAKGDQKPYLKEGSFKNLRTKGVGEGPSMEKKGSFGERTPVGGKPLEGERSPAFAARPAPSSDLTEVREGITPSWQQGKAVPASMGESAPLRGENRSRLLGAVVRAARYAENGIRQEVEISLEPERLGKIRIKATAEGEHLNLSFWVENGEVGQALKETLPFLRQAISHHGFQPGEMEVQLDMDTGERGKGSSFRESFNPSKGGLSPMVEETADTHSFSLDFWV